MKFEQADGKFVLSSRARWIRVTGVGLVLAGTLPPIIVVREVTLGGLLFWSLWVTVLLVSGVMSLRAPDITAEIDVRSRRVTIWAGSLLGTIKRLNVPFDDVASLNLVRHDDGEGGSTFVVDLVLKDGAKCNLTTRLFGSSTIYEEQLAAICEATGFERHDRRGSTFEAFKKQPKLDWQRV